MRTSIARAGVAARLVADRPELWIPGGLAALAFLGWLPLVVAVVPLPDVAGLTFFGTGLVTSEAYPWNVVLLSASVLFGILTLCLLVALGEAALQRGLRPLLGVEERTRDPLTDEAAITFVVLLIALLPAALATLAMAFAISAVAPDEFQSPDIGGPVLVRIARDVSPLLLVVLVATVAGQAFGAVAQRRAVGPRADTITGALRGALRDLRRRPGALIGIALATLAALAALLVVATLLLRVLWAPIGAALRDGELGSPQTVLLLVGFVAIWLCLLLAAGALHAWASAWWSLELQPWERRGHEGAEEREPA